MNESTPGEAPPDLQLDPGTVTVILDESNQEDGIVYAEMTVSTVTEDGYTWTVVMEHWYLLPSYGAPTPGHHIRLKGLDPMVALGTPFPTQVSVENWVKARNNGVLTGVQYHRCRTLRRTLT